MSILDNLDEQYMEIDSAIHGMEEKTARNIGNMADLVKTLMEKQIPGITAHPMFVHGAGNTVTIHTSETGEYIGRFKVVFY